MKIIAGRNFFEQFSHEILQICPDYDWALLEPDGNWSISPYDAEIAVLISDAYCQQFKDTILIAPGIKWVHTENTGVDDSFYRELLTRDVLLTRSPGANAPEVAEFVFGVILWTTKCLGTFHLQQQSGLWKRRQLQSLSDKSILVLGLGAIGSRVAQIAKTFDMNVLGIRKSSQDIYGVDETGTLSELHTFIPQADIIVLALPLSSQTKGLISNREFALMKDTALFINVARGEMVDINALKNHLSLKPDMHACLDVLPDEPWPADDDLWTFPNVLITPHIAWSSPLFRPRAVKVWLANLKHYREGVQLEHLVTA